jgi:hypothetical protein
MEKLLAAFDAAMDHVDFGIAGCVIGGLCVELGRSPREVLGDTRFESFMSTIRRYDPSCTEEAFNASIWVGIARRDEIVEDMRGALNTAKPQRH